MCFVLANFSVLLGCSPTLLRAMCFCACIHWSEFAKPHNFTVVTSLHDGGVDTLHMQSHTYMYIYMYIATFGPMLVYLFLFFAHMEFVKKRFEALSQKLKGISLTSAQDARKRIKSISLEREDMREHLLIASAMWLQGTEFSARQKYTVRIYATRDL